MRRPADIVQPGHVFPLVAHRGGVLARAGHTEACCDLAAARRLFAGRGAVRNHEGRRHDGEAAGPRSSSRALHGLKIGAITDLIHYRSQTERLIERVGERPIRHRRTATFGW